MSDQPGALDQRKARILDAVVREFVNTGEPVGSRRVVEGYGLNVSAATVRSEMAALEDAGYIAQPHTSAGRVPTDKGYRYFVDAIGEPGPIGEREHIALQGFLGRSGDLEELLRRTTQVLAQLTRHAAMVLAPVLDRSRLKLVELVALAPQTVLLLLIADTGTVDKHVLELSTPIGETEVARARAVVNDAAVGLRMADVAAAVASLVDVAPMELRELLGAASEAAATDRVATSPDRVLVGGQASLAGSGSLETEQLHRVFEVLEERLTLSRLLAESTATDRPLVRIGGENPVEELRSTSLVTAGYGDLAPGSVGVIGPRRMDYPSVLATVKAVADQLQLALRRLTDA